MKNTSIDSTSQTIYTVSQLNKEARIFLEQSFSTLWITGEISNFACPSSGHWYFTLKDANACVRCAMFQGRNRATLRPENGMQVLLRAQISLYENRGEFQLIVDYLEPAGNGLLQKAFEALKQRLSIEGLFAPETKKAIPALIQTVGVITSPTGAAIRDILSILKRRFPLLNVIIYPTAVQGNQAASEIASAISLANQRNECEALILARGGGSLEDLWPFNEEIVARAVFASQLPIISAVGHEIDFTISDFVADMRAPTPSAAAELISPDQNDLIQALHGLQQRLTSLLRNNLQQKQQQLTILIHRLQHPKQQLQSQMQQLDNVEKRLQQAMQLQLLQLKQTISHLGRTLNTISPLATLDRGYAILMNENRDIITSSTNVSPADKVIAKLYDSEIFCHVDAVVKN